jgi:hypothetical protein
MARCSVCQKTLKERLLNWRQDKGPFGYEVVAKVGESSYKCVCNRCGHTWLTKTKDAAFQFNEPEVHLRRKRTVEKAIRMMERRKIDGITFLN